MKSPNPIWKMTYKSSRRKHSHRCRECWAVIKEGEEIYMARVKTKVTWCVHTECGDVFIEGSKTHTVYDRLRLQGMEHLVKVGFHSLKKDVDELSAQLIKNS